MNSPAESPLDFRLIAKTFLGHAPVWYKQLVVGFLAGNVGIYLMLGPVVTGWVILAEFIFTLALSLKCYPLQPGGLLALQAIFLGLTNTHAVFKEVEHGLPVLLLVIFMVAGVNFLRQAMFRAVNHVLLNIHSRIALNFTALVVVSIFSSFFDALTILAVLVAVITGFYEAYHRVVSTTGYHDGPDPLDHRVDEIHRQDLDTFRAFLRGLMMHGAIGTAIGGVCTLVGEPENIIVGTEMGWDFMHFLRHVSPATLPTLLAGFLTCLVVEKTRSFGYGADLPAGVRRILEDEDRKHLAKGTARDRLVIVIQAIVGLLMVSAIALHLAEIFLIGLGVIILVSAFSGEIEEHRIAHAFLPGLPFSALLIVFFVIVAVINQQAMFTPVIAWVMTLEPQGQIFAIFATNGILSSISDNVFVAAIYMAELRRAFEGGLTTQAMFDAQAVAVVMGTGIPSMATPNGQAAFLFLLTSPLALLIRLGYGRMIWMALPYTLVTTIVAGASMFWIL
ncbi:MAG: sodium/proton antiporter [Rhodocyclaceae bacterium]|nr:MAG: sodium/proton antiporter [Rhodocyclaceae bacterium]